MANTKDYSMREMIYDECFSSGKEFTCKQLMDIVNKRLEERGMLPIKSRTTFMQDVLEMNSKFHRLYGRDCIVYEDRHKRRYYRYRDGVESIYNRELSDEEVEKLQEVRRLLQGFHVHEGLEPVLFSFNYIHEDKNDWKDIHYRICLGLNILDTFISDYSNDWGYMRVCLERM